MTDFQEEKVQEINNIKIDASKFDLLKGLSSRDSSINKKQTDTVTLWSETKVIELAPKVFEHVWNLDGITNESIMISLDPIQNRK